MSKQTRKQRKKQKSLEKRRKTVGAHLPKELRIKYNTRSFPLRKGDKVKVMLGQFKNKTGKIVKINSRGAKIYIEGIEVIRRDGSKAFRPFHSSNLMITELYLEDKRRKEKIERKAVKKVGI